MHCMILAGGEVRPEDPLYPYTDGKPKALIDMGGVSMLERVVNSLQSSPYVEEILVVGIDDQTAAEFGFQFKRSIHFVADQKSMVGNMLAGAEWFRRNHPETEQVLGCSADIPTITSAIVDQFVETCRPWDKAIYYSFVSRDVLETRFPNSNRTYSRIGGLDVAGGDMVMARIEVVERNRQLIESLTSARKHPWRIAQVVGLGMLLKFIFRRVSFEDMERTASRIIGMPAKVILFDHAELAMDADKPHQVDILRAEFARG